MYEIKHWSDMFVFFCMSVKRHRGHQTESSFKFHPAATGWLRLLGLFFSESNINKSKLVPVWAFQRDWSRVMCWVVLFSGQCDFFKKLFNWWNLSCQILRLFHHSLLLRLHFITFSFSITAKFAFPLPLFIYFFIHPNPSKKKKLSSIWALKKGKSSPFSKSENPLVTTGERSMSAWQVDWVINPHVAVKNISGESNKVIQLKKET